MRDKLLTPAVAGVALVLAVMLAGGVAVWAINSNREDAASAQDLAEQIQRERIRSIRSNCEAQNRRNRNTIETLDELILGMPPGPRKKRAKQNRVGTVLLINSLAPVRDCDRLVEDTASTPPS
jgi:hypothetical protein